MLLRSMHSDRTITLLMGQREYTRLRKIAYSVCEEVYSVRCVMLCYVMTCKCCTLNTTALALSLLLLWLLTLLLLLLHPM
jgi:hypothetical protein